MREPDWPEVQRIYGEGIATGQATFEVEAPDWHHFDASRLTSHRLVAEGPDGGILGWAAVSAVSGRPAYSGVVEHSIYVSESARGQRIGTLLLPALADSTESGGIWTIQASIS
ncbi:N-acetyltransferase family protein [Arthrobacter sp. AL12]|uniref:GNAT family N-acetyltransferase n=1 Tax=Arthrobacter sp. AL12 TaxID=3042241 RepID=UPI0032B825E0